MVVVVLWCCMAEIGEEERKYEILEFRPENLVARPTVALVNKCGYLRFISSSRSQVTPSHIPVEDSDSLIEEIYLSFTPDDPMPSGIEDNDYDSEMDILILEELFDNYSLSLPENESFHFDIPSSSRPPVKPPDGNTGILTIKMMGDISEHKDHMPGLMITRVSNQEKSPDLLSHQGLKTFQPFAECPMMIHKKNTPILDVPLFHFYPLDQFKYRGIRIARIVKSLVLLVLSFIHKSFTFSASF
nr:hypothetical protein [Tanacetum cinerariifolium]